MKKQLNEIGLNSYAQADVGNLVQIKYSEREVKKFFKHYFLYKILDNIGTKT